MFEYTYIHTQNISVYISTIPQSGLNMTARHRKDTKMTHLFLFYGAGNVLSFLYKYFIFLPNKNGQQKINTAILYKWESRIKWFCRFFSSLPVYHCRPNCKKFTHFIRSTAVNLKFVQVSFARLPMLERRVNISIT